MTLRELVTSLRHRLTPDYGEREAKAIIRLIFYSLKGWEGTDMIIHEGDEISEYIQEKIEEILERLARREPIQYILSTAYFYGMDLKVTPATLIPRPETEEMVDLIVKRYGGNKDLKVLDIGTGSGAIAIALSRNLPFSEVTALDFSEEALKVARENAATFKADIDFIHADIFTFLPGEKEYDIIVSNPPYIDESEKKDMERNVLDYEPHTALFVPDDNPLVFYSRIAEVAARGLKPGGALWFEINPRYAVDLVALLKRENFRDIELHKDLYGRERFLSATL